MTTTTPTTTEILALIAAVQARGGVCAFLDCAHSLDTEAVIAAGVRLDDLLISQPDTDEQAGEILETLIRTGAIDLIAVNRAITVPAHRSATAVIVAA